MHLDKNHRNDIFRALVDGGLDPKECKLVIENRRAKITHWPTESCFLIFANSPFGYICGPMGSKMAALRNMNANWTKVRRRVEEWAREIGMPDLWADLQLSADFLGKGQYGGSENTPFTASERVEIAGKIKEVMEHLQNSGSLSSEQMSHVEARFDQAEAASQRIGRKDWLLLFSGVALTLIVTDLVPPAVVQHIFTMTIHGLEHLFSNDPPRQIVS